MYFYRLKLFLNLFTLWIFTKISVCSWSFLSCFSPQSKVLLCITRPPEISFYSTHFTSRGKKGPCWSNTGGFIGHMWPVCFGERAAGCISVPASSLRRECPLICPDKGGAAAPRWRTVDSFFPVVACSAFSAQTGRIPQRCAAWGEWRGENRGRERGGGGGRRWRKANDLRKRKGAAHCSPFHQHYGGEKLTGCTDWAAKWLLTSFRSLNPNHLTHQPA